MPAAAAVLVAINYYGAGPILEFLPSGTTAGDCPCRTLGVPYCVDFCSGPWLAHGLLEGHEASGVDFNPSRTDLNGLLGKLDFVIE